MLRSFYMGKYISVIIGAIVALLGILGLVRWWGIFVLILKGSVPIMLILGGAIAVVAGLSEIRDEKFSKKT